MNEYWLRPDDAFQRVMRDLDGHSNPWPWPHAPFITDVTTLTEPELFCLWMQGYAVGAEIDRRGLGR